MKTINLKGKEYAPVSERVGQLHSDYKEASITTNYDFKEGFVIFSALVKNERGEFTGHAFGKIGQEKAFEKIETTAVGRALAFAGYLAGGEIASYDEVKDFIEEGNKIEATKTTTNSNDDII